MKAYKKVRRLKNGKLYPLFINKTIPYVFGKWLEAEFIPTKGFAERKGFHCCFLPIAPHLADVKANGEIRVWVEVEVEDYVTYNRPLLQGGKWILANKMKVIREVPEEEIKEIINGKS